MVYWISNKNTNMEMEDSIILMSAIVLYNKAQKKETLYRPGNKSEFLLFSSPFWDLNLLFVGKPSEKLCGILS